MSTRRLRRLIAYEVSDAGGMPVEAAPSGRDWMDRSSLRFAYRCLPLVMANQAGWIIRCPVAFRVRWNGGPQVGDVRVSFARGVRESRVCSHFGEGVLTFTLPYLFRTPRGVNLWVKGPSNWVKDGIQPLEGIVEADWSHTTFTMNWKLTRPNHTVRFEAGEPICMIVPIPRDLAERLDPVRRPIDANRRLAAAYRAWCDSRQTFNEGLARQEHEYVRRGWQRDYMLGRDAQGGLFPEHQTKLHLRPFRQGS